MKTLKQLLWDEVRKLLSEPLETADIELAIILLKALIQINWQR